MSDARGLRGDDHIVYQGVKKAFGEKVIYELLDLTVRRGETLTVCGGSGTGKSVMLRMLIGLLKPDEGRVLVDGEDIVPLGEDELLPLRRRVSMLFQGGALFDSISVGENVAWPLQRQTSLSAQEIAERVADRLALVGLPGIQESRPADLSGGMRKRVALARAIAGDPEVVLYDEPTTGLDPVNTRRISELIRSIQGRLGITSIVVTHDMPSAFLVSDRIAMLHQRRILAVLPTDEFRRAREPAIHDFVNAMTLPSDDDPVRDVATPASPAPSPAGISRSVRP